MRLLDEGQKIRDTYEVERFLGEGAFAEVYRVRHRFLGRQGMKVCKRVGVRVLAAVSLWFVAVSSMMAADQLQDVRDLYLLLDRRRAAKLDMATAGVGARQPQHRLFAVLINGASEAHHQTNIYLASDSLKKLGADENNIFILSTAIRQTSDGSENPADTLLRVAARPSVAHLKIVLEYLGVVITSNDVVFLYMTGHGGKEDRRAALRDLGILLSSRQDYETNLTTLELPGADLTALDFRSHLVCLQWASHPLIVFLSDECFSGGMAQAVRETAVRHIAMSTTDEDHTTSCRISTPAFWNILSSQDPDTHTYPSLKAAFEKAMFNRQMLETKKERGKGGYFSSAGLDNFSIANFLREGLHEKEGR